MRIQSKGEQGDVKLNSGAGSVKLYANSQLNGAFHLETGAGTVNVPESLGLTIEKRMVGGEAHGQIGYGGPRWDLNSGAGSVSIELSQTASTH